MVMLRGHGEKLDLRPCTSFQLDCYDPRHLKLLVPDDGLLLTLRGLALLLKDNARQRS